jgi:hypothetical protein
LERFLNLVFLINLFRDTNVARIFYKSSQTCGHKNRKRHLIGDRGSTFLFVLAVVLHVSDLRLLELTEDLSSWWLSANVFACPNAPLDLPDRSEFSRIGIFMSTILG